jgi:UDP-3-O-[3-hydroxymyristoyl] glucosamine N-acyltransferase
MKLISLLLLLNNRIGSLGSILMKTFLRINGAKIGRNTYVSLSSRIVAKKSLVIGNDCVIKSHVKIKANDINIGHNCVISENTYIKLQM